MSFSRAVTIPGESDKPGAAARSLADALYSELSKDCHRQNNNSVVQLRPIDPVTNSGFTGWQLDIGNSQTMNSWLVTEFQPDQHLPTETWPLVLWLLSWPRRAYDFARGTTSSYKKPDSSARRQRVWERILRWWRILKKVPMLLFMIFIFYFQVLPAALVIRPIRKLGGFVFTLYFVLAIIALAGFFVLVLGQAGLSGIVLQISNLTQTIVNNVQSYNVKIDFNTLFPVIAGLVGTIAISALAVLVRIIGWVFRWFTAYGPFERRRERQFSYLVSPAYASLLTSQLGKHLNAFYSNPSIKEVCLIVDGEGILVGYDVLSHMQNGKDKRSLLVTYGAVMAGMYVLPNDDTWFAINSNYWAKFEVPLAGNISWHHVTSSFRKADSISVKSPAGTLLAEVPVHSRNRFNKYKSLANCLVHWPTAKKAEGKAVKML